VLPNSSFVYNSWSAIYVKNRHEKRVALTLERKGYEVFLPTYVKFDERGRKFELPLFPSYVFCRFETLMPLPILTTPGVFSIVCTGCVPAAIPQSEIDGIRRLVGTELAPRPWPYLSPGQTVCLHSGPLRGIRGVVVDDSNEKWLVLSVHVLQRSVAVKIERASLDGVTLWDDSYRHSAVETNI
jgi:transcription termination/antitermination protein NusG